MIPLRLCVVAAALLAMTFAVALDAAPKQASADGPPVIRATDSASLEAKIGTEVVVEGLVREIGTAPGDDVRFLNFGRKRGGFVAVIFREFYGNFPEGFEIYKQRKVRVEGILEKYRNGQIQIRLNSADQARIVEP